MSERPCRQREGRLIRRWGGRRTLGAAWQPAGELLPMRHARSVRQNPRQTGEGDIKLRILAAFILEREHGAGEAAQLQ